MARYTWQKGDYKTVRVSLPMDNPSIPWLRAVIREAAHGSGFPRTSLQALLLGITEACSNAIKHGIPGENASIEVDARICQSEAIVRMYYASEPFIFGSLFCIDPEQSCTSGIGHSLMRVMLDEVHYRFRNGWTFARLIKKA